MSVERLWGGDFEEPGAEDTAERLPSVDTRSVPVCACVTCVSEWVRLCVCASG